jgi:internalin A
MIDVRGLIDDVLSGGKTVRTNATDIKIFVSYSHQDSDWLTKLEKYLKPLSQNIDLWSDRRINPGDEWAKEIKTALDTAQIAILLVSQDFIASDFINTNELLPLLDAAQAQDVKILWIPIRYSSHEDMDFSDYQALHNPNQPLNSLPVHEQERALVEIGKKIKRIITA